MWTRTLKTWKLKVSLSWEGSSARSLTDKHILKNNFENFCKLFCQIKVSLNVIMKTLQGLGRSLILLNIVLFIQTISGQIGSVQRCFDEQCQSKIFKFFFLSNNFLWPCKTNQIFLIFYSTNFWRPNGFKISCQFEFDAQF